jgi:hypothetical protein
MKVDKFFLYLMNTLNVLTTVFINTFVSKGKTLVGADCLVQWEDEDEPFHCYLSFSDYPADEDFDDFGVVDSEVFYYCEGIKELLSSMWKGNRDGWRMQQVSLVYATPIR